MNFRCICCNAIYDRSPLIPEYEGMEVKGVCGSCIVEQGLEPPKTTGEANAD